MRVVVYVVAALGWMVLVAAKSASQRGGCYSDEFSCQYGTCIPNYKVCDGHEDCPYYGDDENGCTSSTYYPQTSHCPDNEYECMSGSCIPEYWLCDGTTDCPVYGDDEDHCSSHDSSTATTATTTTSTTTTTLSTGPPPFECGGTFDYIYDRCVLVDPFTYTTWDEARYFCQKINSDLVVVDDFNFYSKLLHFINSRGLENHNYWVGARDQQEGVWRWIDYTLVHVGAPLWALYGCTGDYHVEPRPSEAGDQDCGYLDTSRGLYMSDASCDEEFAAICQGRTIGKEVKEETKAKEPTAIEEMKDDGDEEDTAEEVSEGTRKEKNESKEKETVTIEENDEKEDKVKAKNGDKEEERKEVEEEEE